MNQRTKDRVMKGNDDWKKQLAGVGEKFGLKPMTGRQKPRRPAVPGVPRADNDDKDGAMLPLPQDIRNQLGALNDAPNLSLYFYKWADVYKENFTATDAGKKKSFFKRVEGFSTSGAYAKALSTRLDALNTIGRTFQMETASRLVFGTGYDHPTENGFTFDWTTGLPLIPGSSLKGAALKAAGLFLDGSLEVPGLTLDDVHREKIIDIFGYGKGSEGRLGKGFADSGGRVIFVPARPVPDAGDNSFSKGFLEVDIMAPHYGPYYNDPDNNPPADWYQPVPILFLCVRRGVLYEFRVADRLDLTGGDKTLLNIAEKLLKAAFMELGVGAMTAVAYGYFTEPNKKTVEKK